MGKGKNDLDILGANIAKYRKEKGLTQDKLAELLYVSDKTVSKWETGKSGPDILIISDLADVLGVVVGYSLFDRIKDDIDMIYKFAIIC